MSAAGIEVVTGVSGKVSDAVQAYKSGRYKTSSQPNVADHFGMGIGAGMGRGMGAGMMPAAGPAPQPTSTEVETLNTQLEVLTQNLSEIQRRIEELGKKSE